MNTLSSPQIVAFGMSMFLLITLPLDCYSFAKAYGSTLAKKLMPNAILTSVLIAVGLSLLAFSVPLDIEGLLSIIFLGLAIFWWGSVIALLLRRSADREILLDLGLLSQVSRELVIIMFISGVGLIVLAPFAGHIYYAFFGLSALAQATRYVIKNRERAAITDIGLEIMPTTIRWTHIKHYQWDKEVNGMALLVVQSKTRPAIFATKILRIPPPYKDETRTLLAEYVRMS